MESWVRDGEKFPNPHSKPMFCWGQCDIVLFMVIFVQLTNLCSDTVTLKKKTPCIMLVTLKKKGWFTSACIPVHVFCSKGFCLLVWVILCAVPYVLPFSEENSAVLVCICWSLNAKIVQYCLYRSVFCALYGRLMCEGQRGGRCSALRSSRHPVQGHRRSLPLGGAVAPRSCVASVQ